MAFEDAQPEGSATAVQLFKEALAATGKIGMAELCERARTSHKVVHKHRKAGLIKGERRLVFGKLIWLFDPADVDQYLLIVRETIAQSRQRGARASGGAKLVKVPAGFMSVAQIADATDRSVWFVYDYINVGFLDAERGPKGALFVPQVAAELFISNYRYLPSPEGWTTIPEAAEALGASESVLRSAFKLGKLRAISIGEKRTQRTTSGQVGRAIWHVLMDDVRRYLVEERLYILPES